jgi:allophanate hydrolase
LPDDAAAAPPAPFRFGIPADRELEFFGDPDAPRLYEQALRRLEGLGGQRVVLDFGAFREAAALLYDGPWVAERSAALRAFERRRGSSMLPVIRTILARAHDYSAADLFDGIYRLQALRRTVGELMAGVDFCVTPTAPTIYTIRQVTEAPLVLNKQLGYYTHCVNLLDLCAVAVPAGFDRNGLPFGISLLAPWAADRRLLAAASRYHQALGGCIGAGMEPLPAVSDRATDERAAPSAYSSEIDLAVVGAHLSGQPLNHQLTGLGARLQRVCRTAQCYRLYALGASAPAKPGMVLSRAGGRMIEVEVWRLAAKAFGQLVATVAAPLTIGNVLLEDGTTTKGFLCESYAVDCAVEITGWGGWRAYLDSSSKAPP